uniref:Uncharacterized protein n=1 Tax=Theropithecus gelada TaxID=9565 RepID=A0A8D2K7M2_THEGE
MLPRLECSGDPLTSGSQSARITGMSHRTQLVICIFNKHSGEREAENRAAAETVLLGFCDLERCKHATDRQA